MVKYHIGKLIFQELPKVLLKYDIGEVVFFFFFLAASF